MLPPENHKAPDFHETCSCMTRFRAFFDTTVESGIRILRSLCCPSVV